MRLLAIAVVVACSKAAAPPPAPSGPVHLTFRSPDHCEEADIAIVDPDADIQKPHQVNQYVHMFPDVDVEVDAKVGEHVLLIDRLPPPIEIRQRLPVTAGMRVIALRHSARTFCTLLPEAL